MVRDSALHREAAEETNREEHGSLAGRRILGASMSMLTLNRLSRRVQAFVKMQSGERSTIDVCTDFPFKVNEFSIRSGLPSPDALGKKRLMNRDRG